VGPQHIYIGVFGLTGSADTGDHRGDLTNQQLTQHTTP
jgi:hypothetical protein